MAVRSGTPWRVVGAVAAGLALSGCPARQEAALPPAPEPQGPHEQALYALGVLLARNVAVYTLTPAELAMVEHGLADATQGRPLAARPQDFDAPLRDLARARQAARVEAEKLRGRQLLEKALAEPGAEKLASGAVYLELARGKGDSPQPTDTARVHFRSTLPDGTEVENTVARGLPMELPLNGVVRCWTEGLLRLRVGGKARLVCPPESAYGDRGHAPGIPGGATLAVEVELLEVVRR